MCVFIIFIEDIDLARGDGNIVSSSSSESDSESEDGKQH